VEQSITFFLLKDFSISTDIQKASQSYNVKYFNVLPNFLNSHCLAKMAQTS